MIVMKFGGSSVESAAAIGRVARIVEARLDKRPVVVVSAMGKTTNRLLAIGSTAAEGRQVEAMAMAAGLRAFHYEQAIALGIPEPAIQEVLDEHFHELDAWIADMAELEQFSPERVDDVSALGERLSSWILALAFRQKGIETAHIDSRRVILTDNRHTHASPIFELTYRKLLEVVEPLAAEKVVVMGGFIGSTPEGVTTTLGRGGSDYTASIVGAGIRAEEIQIWTDVDGMLSCDPRIAAGGHRLKTISFAEAAELAYFGAKVLHPATVLPAIEKNIPVRVLNSRNPHSEGTRIIKEMVPCRNIIKSIACKRDITVVKIHSLRMLMAHGFLRRIFEVFDRFETPVDIVTTSEVSVSLTIDNPRYLPEIREELEKIAQVEVEPARAIVCVVGDNIRNTPGVAARIFGALANINVLMISQGASQLNFSVVLDGEDLRRAVESLHAEFLSDPDPEVFG